MFHSERVKHFLKPFLQMAQTGGLLVYESAPFWRELEGPGWCLAARTGKVKTTGASRLVLATAENEEGTPSPQSKA